MTDRRFKARIALAKLASVTRVNIEGVMTFWATVGQIAGTAFLGGVGGAVGERIGSSVDAFAAAPTAKDKELAMLSCISGRMLQETDGLAEGSVLKHAATLQTIVDHPSVGEEEISVQIRKLAFDSASFGEIVAATAGDQEAAVFQVVTLWRAAAADGVVSNSEIDWINRYCVNVCLPEERAADIRSLYVQDGAECSIRYYLVSNEERIEEDDGLGYECRCYSCEQLAEVDIDDDAWERRCESCQTLLLLPESSATGMLEELRNRVGFPTCPTRRTHFVIVREELSELAGNRLRITPDLDEAKLETAIDKYGFDLTAADVLVHLDDTVTGNAGDGFVITAQSIAWKNSSEPAFVIDLPDIEFIGVRAGGVFSSTQINLRYRTGTLSIRVGQDNQYEIAHAVRRVLKKLKEL